MLSYNVTGIKTGQGAQTILDDEGGIRTWEELPAINDARVFSKLNYMPKEANKIVGFGTDQYVPGFTQFKRNVIAQVEGAHGYVHRWDIKNVMLELGRNWTKSEFTGTLEKYHRVMRLDGKKGVVMDVTAKHFKIRWDDATTPYQWEEVSKVNGGFVKIRCVKVAALFMLNPFV